MDLPFLTSGYPPMPGIIKSVPADFYVQELPLYQPSGAGTHTYFWIQKEGLTTLHAIKDIARALNVKPSDIGYAGLKDAHAITRQMLSIEHIEPHQIEALNLPRIKILSISRHTNKLRLGHLRANRFRIKLRRANSGFLNQIREVLGVLSRRGVPNYFGPQRFGARGDTWKLGRNVLQGDWKGCLDVLLGQPGPTDERDVLRARQLYDAGRIAEAAQTWPRPMRDQRRACQVLAKTGSHRRAFLAVDRALRRLYVSAYQAFLFNQVLAERIDHIDRLMPGDLAWRHDNEAVFRVQDVAAEQPRCDAFEISPSGPIFGYRMTSPTGEPAQIEERILSQEGITPATFRAAGLHKVKGARRPLRFRPTDCSVQVGTDELGDFVELRFVLPAGCYATAVLREICKRDVS